MGYAFRSPNPAAFASPALGTLSTMGRNNLPGPRLWTFDTAFSREFSFRERGRLEFRAEAFDVTNSMRPGISLPSLQAGASGLGLTFGTPTFGQITSSMDTRILQVALKFSFLSAGRPCGRIEQSKAHPLLGRFDLLAVDSVDHQQVSPRMEIAVAFAVAYNRLGFFGR